MVGGGPVVVPATADHLVPVRHLVGVGDVQCLVLLQQAVAPAGHRHAHPVLRVRLPVPPAGGRDRPQGLRWLAVGVFVVAWIAQFIGHKFEGRKPSFLTDLTYLLIGPAWVMAKLYRKLDWRY
ncbi:Mpo1-like protein [Stenotrophomonas pavanii]|nr:Mpo1-like protein [Stenotrophomonas pavanii]MDT3463277.1 Mpo1-like protein [Stenotrophomonas pavanii]